MFIIYKMVCKSVIKSKKVPYKKLKHYGNVSKTIMRSNDHFTDGML